MRACNIACNVHVHLCVRMEAAALTPRMYMVLGAYLGVSACLGPGTAVVLTLLHGYM